MEAYGIFFRHHPHVTYHNPPFTNSEASFTARTTRTWEILVFRGSPSSSPGVCISECCQRLMPKRLFDMWTVFCSAMSIVPWRFSIFVVFHGEIFTKEKIDMVRRKF